MTQLPIGIGSKSLPLPVSTPVFSDLSLTLFANSLACCIMAKLVLNFRLHYNSDGLLSMPVIGVNLKMSSANHTSLGFLAMRFLIV